MNKKYKAHNSFFYIKILPARKKGAKMQDAHFFNPFR